MVARATKVERVERTRKQASNIKPEDSGQAMGLVVDKVRATAVLDLVLCPLWHLKHNVG